MHDLSVVIVNFNSGPCLEACLSSLGPALGDTRWHTIVVDNQSTDGSERAVHSFADRVSLVPAGSNLGFGRAANLGASRTDAARLLFVNPDCRLAAGCLEPLQAELDAHPRCAIVAPLVLNEDGSPQGNARGDPTMLTGLFGRTTVLTRLFPRAGPVRRNIVVPGRGDAAAGSSSVVDWVSGACFLARRAAFSAAGGFDERYFLYWEDADLCRRLRAGGWTIRLRTDARATHLGSRSSRTARREAILAFHRSAYLYYATHVARSPWNISRWLAAALLALRCGLKLGGAAWLPARER
jgi:N-acetylglucosaminyl-diphospho-decaprenol L-rhamnosyltransferase